jgi:2-iminobutanoate/2-iminopropanoate deaminase
VSQAPIFHNFDKAPTHVAPFSHAVEADGWIQLTGQMPTHPDDDSAPLPDGVKAQTRRVMDNLVIVLEGLDLDLSNVLSCRVYLTEFARDYEAMNQTYWGNRPRALRAGRDRYGRSASLNGIGQGLRLY